MNPLGSGAITIIVIVVIMLLYAIRILREYERGVIFRLGRLVGAKGPGIFILWPIIDKMVKVSLRVVTMDVPEQDIITKDNVTVRVNAVVYFRVMDPVKAVVAVEDYLYATSMISQTTLRAVLGQAELDTLLAERDKVNEQLQHIIDEDTEPWGIKVTKVEVKNVDIPQEMQRAIARQAEAERERRAKVIHAEGEMQAAEKLRSAAAEIAKEGSAIQLRFLQTLTEVAAEKNSTLIFPVPIDLLEPIIEAKQRKQSSGPSV
jgi:regulator of protease activity HflC (stomatin/prohibitin superfamily)